MALIVCATLNFGCGGKPILPNYSLSDTDGREILVQAEGQPVEDGWEFSLPQPYWLESVTVYYNHSLKAIRFQIMDDGAWQPLLDEVALGPSPCVVPLKAYTDSIRLFPTPIGENTITLCQFRIKKVKRLLSVPLEKPPFIK